MRVVKVHANRHHRESSHGAVRIRFDGAVAVPSVRSAPAYSRTRSPTPTTTYCMDSLPKSSNSTSC